MTASSSAKKLTAADVWEKYRKGVERMAADGLPSRDALCHRMYEGDQWYGIEKDGENLPKLNFIKPVVNYKVSTVAKNDMSVSYTPTGVAEADRDVFTEACVLLSTYAAQQWEQLKMADKVWDIVEAAAITGTSALYFAGSGDECVIVDNDRLILGDEAERDIQAQPYIIIAERRRVDDVKHEAKEAGLSDDEIASITPDTDDSSDTKRTATIREDDKCTALIFMRKVGDVVHVLRSVEGVIYDPEHSVSSSEADSVPNTMQLYPITLFAWGRKFRSARGVGEVHPLVPNQIEVNRSLVRRSIASKASGFPKVVYDSDAIDNPQDINKVGAAIKLKGMDARRVNEIIGYLSAAPMSPDAAHLQNELLTLSRELAGAGEAATGNVNPERASGAAIIAVQDQAALPLNKQAAAYRQFVEDIALIWFDLWRVYNPAGMTVEQDDFTQSIDADTIERLRVSVRIDVSPASPFSKFAREQALENAMAGDKISFEEYVDALDEDATAPKSKLQAILEKRMQMQAAQMPPGGGDALVMPDMQGGGIHPPQGGGPPAMALPQPGLPQV